LHRVRDFFKGSADHAFELFKVDLEQFKFQDEKQVHVLRPVGLQETENLAHAAFATITGDGSLKNLGGCDKTDLGWRLARTDA
jgi:hypothetical protein